jgi:formiminotetrahydrofolate cyclodeaminase
MACFFDLTLAQFVDAIGQDRPAPGCGGAAALALAMAAACARKAFVISARRRGGDAELQAAGERCRVLSEAAVTGVQRDGENFKALLKAPHGADGPAQALEGDAEVLLSLAAELRAMVERHSQAVVADLAGDLAAALALTDAFERIETGNLLNP